MNRILHSIMPMLLTAPLLVLPTGVLGQATTSAPAVDQPGPVLARFALDNGLRATVFAQAGSRSLQLLTFLPGGLMADEAGHVMWARLIERLVTQTAGSSDGIAEAPYVVLRTAAWPEELETALDEHVRLLRPMTFQQKHLELYCEHVIAEAMWWEQRERNALPEYAPLDGFRAAEAAFAQACRHGRSTIGFDDDVGLAALADVQGEYGRRWSCADALLCIVGDVEVSRLEQAVRQRFSRLIGSTRPAIAASRPAATSVNLTPRQLKIGWDLTSRYFCLAWPTPQRSDRDEAALIVARNLIARDWSAGADWQIGLLELRLDARLGEAPLIWAGVSLRTDVPVEAARESWAQRVSWLRRGVQQPVLDKARKRVLEVLGLEPPEPSSVRSLRKDGYEVTPKLAARPDNRDLEQLVKDEETQYFEWCELEWSYGRRLSAIRDEIRRVDAAAVARVAGKYLSEKQAIEVVISPGTREGS